VSADRPQYIWKGEVPAELIYGVHIRLDGGEVDRTIRPGRRVSAEELRDLASPNGSTAPPASRDEENRDAG
jgi:hypothetical protein